MQNNIKILMLIIIFFHTSLYSNYCTGEYKTNKIIAIIDKDPILESDIQNTIHFLNLENNHIHNTKNYNFDIQNNILDQLINETLILQLAKRRNINIDDNQINEIISYIITHNHITNDQLQNYLNSNNISYNNYREQIRKNTITQIILNHEMHKRIKILPYELKMFTQKIKNQNTMYQLDHILIPIEKHATLDQIKYAQTLAKFLTQEMKHGVNTQILPILYSHKKQKIHIKQINWSNLEELPNLFANHLMFQDIEKNNIIGPLHSSIGFHILKIKNTYNTYKQDISKKVHIRNIMLKRSIKHDDQKIQQILLKTAERIKQGYSTFYIEAKRISEDLNTASQGGDLGWKYIEDFNDIKLQNFIKCLMIGEISQPIQTTSGWYLIQLIDANLINKNTIQCEKSAYQLILDNKYLQEQKNWIHELRTSTYIKIL